MDNEIINYSTLGSLPCRAERTKIVEQAKLLLTKVRAVAEQLDGYFAPLAAERPAEGTNAAASSFVAPGTTAAFCADQS